MLGLYKLFEWVAGCPQKSHTSRRGLDDRRSRPTRREPDVPRSDRLSRDRSRSPDGRSSFRRRRDTSRDRKREGNDRALLVVDENLAVEFVKDQFSREDRAALRRLERERLAELPLLVQWTIQSVTNQNQTRAKNTRIVALPRVEPRPMMLEQTWDRPIVDGVANPLGRKRPGFDDFPPAKILVTYALKVRQNTRHVTARQKKVKTNIARFTLRTPVAKPKVTGNTVTREHVDTASTSEPSLPAFTPSMSIPNRSSLPTTASSISTTAANWTPPNQISVTPPSTTTDPLSAIPTIAKAPDSPPRGDAFVSQDPPRAGQDMSLLVPPPRTSRQPRETCSVVATSLALKPALKSCITPVATASRQKKHVTFAVEDDISGPGDVSTSSTRGSPVPPQQPAGRLEVVPHAQPVTPQCHIQSGLENKETSNGEASSVKNSADIDSTAPEPAHPVEIQQPAQVENISHIAKPVISQGPEMPEPIVQGPDHPQFVGTEDREHCAQMEKVIVSQNVPEDIVQNVEMGEDGPSVFTTDEQVEWNEAQPPKLPAGASIDVTDFGHGGVFRPEIEQQLAPEPPRLDAMDARFHTWSEADQLEYVQIICQIIGLNIDVYLRWFHAFPTMDMWACKDWSMFFATTEDAGIYWNGGCRDLAKAVRHRNMVFEQEESRRQAALYLQAQLEREMNLAQLEQQARFQTPIQEPDFLGPSQQDGFQLFDDLPEEIVQSAQQATPQTPAPPEEEDSLFYAPDPEEEATRQEQGKGAKDEELLGFESEPPNDTPITPPAPRRPRNTSNRCLPSGLTQNAESDTDSDDDVAGPFQSGKRWARAQADKKAVPLTDALNKLGTSKEEQSSEPSIKLKSQLARCLERVKDRKRLDEDKKRNEEERLRKQQLSQPKPEKKTAKASTRPPTLPPPVGISDNLSPPEVAANPELAEDVDAHPPTQQPGFPSVPADFQLVTGRKLQRDTRVLGDSGNRMPVYGFEIDDAIAQFKKTEVGTLAKLRNASHDGKALVEEFMMKNSILQQEYTALNIVALVNQGIYGLRELQKEKTKVPHKDLLGTIWHPSTLGSIYGRIQWFFSKFLRPAEELKAGYDEVLRAIAILNDLLPKMPDNEKAFEQARARHKIGTKYFNQKPQYWRMETGEDGDDIAGVLGNVLSPQEEARRRMLGHR
ncbi:hypothetical protein BCR34DRAFT_666973 [Clohesyomyces aquaticus]|uniref:Uncharacterized protein n=1 Tax=Clohesyomyces aquaticus TaxID=1231657 RepID=A0A1Y1Z3Y7_9PLEO|nr:hypothetical protein BCR34DRAFT_666973 [Clohesyomyces aquaticus]